MVKEIKMYEAQDGTLFKSKQGANNRNKKLTVDNVLSTLSMTKEEVNDKLEIASKHNKFFNLLLEHEPDWTKWATHQILSINSKSFEEPQKKVEYVMKSESYWDTDDTILFTELADEFTDPELHCADKYVVAKVEEVNKFAKKVYYDYKYAWDERILSKLNAGEILSESEIADLIMNLEAIYEEEGDDRRWSKSVLSVVDLAGHLFAIEWEKGLTENQENEYYEQPYPVELKKEEKVITTIITKVIRRELATVK